MGIGVNRELRSTQTRRVQLACGALFRDVPEFDRIRRDLLGLDKMYGAMVVEFELLSFLFVCCGEIRAPGISVDEPVFSRDAL